MAEVLDEATVRKIARLARIAVADGDLAHYQRELTNILTWIGQLDEVDTRDVPPMTRVVDVPLPQREDVVTDGGYAADVLANAPETAAGFFVVPKVVE